MARPPSLPKQLRMLELLREKGLILAGHDSPILRHLEFRRYAKALPLHDIRGRTNMARAWQITDAGVAAALRLAAPVRRRRGAPAEAEQIDLEEAIASSGERPVSPPLTDPDAPAVTAADVSAPEGRSSRRSARGRQPEHATP